MAESLTIDPILTYGTQSHFETTKNSATGRSYFRWSESGFLGSDRWSQKCIIPSYYDASDGDLIYTFWASGQAHSPISYLGIDWQNSNSSKLSPAYRAGLVYSHNNKLPLLSDAAIRYIPQSDNAITLTYPPKIGETFSISSYKYNSETGNVEVYRPFRVLNSFDDGDNYQAELAISTEYKTELIDSASGGPLYTITLSDSADINYSPQFERSSIFRIAVSSTPNEDGEWKFTSATTIQVYITNSTSIGYWGRVTYKLDSPITLTPKSFWGENKESEIGVSDGSANQYFSLPYFPTHSISVLVNGTAWTPVANITSSGNYVGVDEDLGIIWFGNGVLGNIPSAGSRITCNYTVVPLIAYEPNFSKVRIIGSEINLIDQSTLSEGRGFVIASPQTTERRILNLDESYSVATISLSVQSGTDVGEPLLCAVRALDSFSRPVKNALIKLNVGNPSSGSNISLMRVGRFSEPIVKTNSEGYAYSYFIPSQNFWDYLVAVNLFQRGQGENPNGSRGISLSSNYSIASSSLRVYNTHEAYNDLLNLFDTASATSGRIFAVTDSDEWSPFNYELRTGGKIVRPYLASLHSVLNITAIIKASTFVTILSSGFSAALPQNIVQFLVGPIRTNLWATLYDNDSIFSSMTTRLFDIIQEDGVDGHIVADENRVLQAGWLDPAGENWPS